MKNELQETLTKLRKENKHIEIYLKNIKDKFTPVYFKSDLDKILSIEKVGSYYRINGELFKPTKDEKHNTDLVIKKKFDINSWRKKYL
jgi:hypothetical protein